MIDVTLQSIPGSRIWAMSEFYSSYQQWSSRPSENYLHYSWRSVQTIRTNYNELTHLFSEDLFSHDINQ